ncbi:hypothetical protein ABG067_008277, partial [Albugo candida]
MFNNTIFFNFKEANAHQIDQLIYDYCWKQILKDPSSKLPEFSQNEKDQVDAILKGISEKLEIIPNTYNISRAPEKFIPALAYICDETEKEADNTDDQKKKPRLFQLTPQPSLKWRYISVNNKALASIAKIKFLTGGYTDSLRMFYQVFDFKKFGYH